MAFVVPYVIMTAVSAVTYYVMMQGMKVEGAKLGDIAKQTAQEGTPRVIVWGAVRPIGGNIVACSEPRIVTSSSGGGKGGAPETTSESVYRTYAIGICEGPVTGIRRVWRNNKIVYDTRLDGSILNTWGAANNPIFLQKTKFYLGSYSQLPDPSLEAVFGVGNVPAMRGTCYMVVHDEDLTELGGALPQYIFEVERAEGIFLTSKPYALEVVESAQSLGGSLVSGDFKAQLRQYNSGVESIESLGGSLIEGNFRATVTGFDGGVESAQSLGGSLVSGDFYQDFVLVTYDDGLPESVQSSGGELLEGVFRAGLITYDDGLPESIQSLGGSLVEGSHGT